MRLAGQRWRFQIGNHLVDIDNGYSWSQWAQERLRTGEETVQSPGAWLGVRHAFDEPWMTSPGDGELTVRLKSRVAGVECVVMLDDRPVEPDQLFRAVWRGGRHDRPPADTWREKDRHAFRF